jgi:hypothetical protein
MSTFNRLAHSPNGNGHASANGHASGDGSSLAPAQEPDTRSTVLCTCDTDSDTSPPGRTARPARQGKPPMAQPQHSTPATSDTTTRLRLAILAAARLLLGRNGPFAGEVSVTIEAPDEGLEVRVKPTARCTGLDADVNTLATGDAMLLARVEQLVAHFLSADERLLLRTLAELEPCSATTIQNAVRSAVKKSDFWSMWGQLQHRRLVHQQEDKTYTLAVDWVREMIGES